jgi:predicted nucleic acid-binding protein
LIFLDTNLVSESVRLIPNLEIVSWLLKKDAELCLATVVLAEVAFGIGRIRPQERPKRLIGFVETLRQRFHGRIYSFDEQAAVVYGEIMGTSQLRGLQLSTPDGMIAAIAIRHGATLATRNVKDFEFLKLKVVNPWT